MTTWQSNKITLDNHNINTNIWCDALLWCYSPGFILAKHPNAQRMTFLQRNWAIFGLFWLKIYKEVVGKRGVLLWILTFQGSFSYKTSAIWPQWNILYARDIPILIPATVLKSLCHRISRPLSLYHYVVVKNICSTPSLNFGDYFSIWCFITTHSMWNRAQS